MVVGPAKKPVNLCETHTRWSVLLSLKSSLESGIKQALTLSARLQTEGAYHYQWPPAADLGPTMPSVTQNLPPLYLQQTTIGAHNQLFRSARRRAAAIVAGDLRTQNALEMSVEKFITMFGRNVRNSPSLVTAFKFSRQELRKRLHRPF
ncbi:hypothetical protein BaRGS_00019210 [Batillaria attramentaria]|uniref:Uncharacterized protein n=1 Tax=Batillaria attramentaria TaxID=370345 RepID=A0ABD0KRI8_9CAEN